MPKRPPKRTPPKSSAEDLPLTGRPCTPPRPKRLFLFTTLVVFIIWLAGLCWMALQSLQ